MEMRKLLTRKFFQNKNTPEIAKHLLGKFLIRRWRDKTKAYMITEVEAYDGFKDKASHAYRGQTKRNKIMFGPAGHWYIYFTYGIHWMLNIVTGPVNYPAAILIRGIKGINGPARLTKTLKINKKLNGKLADKKSGLWIKNKGVKIKSSQIKNTPRIGISYAGPIWSKKKWRFYIDFKKS